MLQNFEHRPSLKVGPCFTSIKGFHSICLDFFSVLKVLLEACFRTSKLYLYPITSNQLLSLCLKFYGTCPGYYNIKLSTKYHLLCVKSNNFGWQSANNLFTQIYSYFHARQLMYAHFCLSYNLLF